MLNVVVFREDFTPRFQELVDRYKKLPAPPVINVELKTVMAIESEETPAPEIDYCSVKQFLKRLPPSRKVTKQRWRVENKAAALLVLDFRQVKEVTPPALPKVTTTYICRERAAVVNEWHFALLQFKELPYGIGILFYVPGTELWSFINVFVPDGYPTSTLSGDSFQFPLDLIAWQIFDFFTHRITSYRLHIEEIFAPFSLSCHDGVLAGLLSSLFQDLGFSPERQIKISKKEQTPMEYWQCIVTLPDKRSRSVPVSILKTVLACASCFRLFPCISVDLSLCKFCSKTYEDYQRGPDKALFGCGYLRGKGISSISTPGDANFIVHGGVGLAFNYLQRSFHFTKKRNTELTGMRKLKGGCKEGSDSWGVKETRIDMEIDSPGPVGEPIAPFGAAKRPSSEAKY